MAKVGIFFADGCEEIEGLAVVDICRRAGLEIQTISIMGRDIVAGSHRIKFQTDAVFEDVDFDTLDGVILPGGMPGTLQLGDHERVNGIIREFAEQKKLVLQSVPHRVSQEQQGSQRERLLSAIRDLKAN